VLPREQRLGCVLTGAFGFAGAPLKQRKTIRRSRYPLASAVSEIKTEHGEKPVQAAQGNTRLLVGLRSDQLLCRELTGLDEPSLVQRSCCRGEGLLEGKTILHPLQLFYAGVNPKVKLTSRREI